MLSVFAGERITALEVVLGAKHNSNGACQSANAKLEAQPQRCCM